MSTYWGYICFDCHKSSNHVYNHGQERLIELYTVRKFLIDNEIDLEYCDIQMDSNYDVEISIFLEEHITHKMGLENEHMDTIELPIDLPKEK